MWSVAFDIFMFRSLLSIQELQTVSKKTQPQRHHIKDSSKYTCWLLNWHVHSDLRQLFIKSPADDIVLEMIMSSRELVSCLVILLECLCKTLPGFVLFFSQSGANLAESNNYSLSSVLTELWKISGFVRYVTIDCVSIACCVSPAVQEENKWKNWKIKVMLDILCCKNIFKLRLTDLFSYYCSFLMNW